MNLRTYPWIEERVKEDKLSIHGGYYDFLNCSFEKWTLDVKGSNNTEEVAGYSVKDRVHWFWNFFCRWSSPIFILVCEMGGIGCVTWFVTCHNCAYCTCNMTLHVVYHRIIAWQSNGFVTLCCPPCDTTNKAQFKSQADIEVCGCSTCLYSAMHVSVTS